MGGSCPIRTGCDSSQGTANRLTPKKATLPTPSIQYGRRKQSPAALARSPSPRAHPNPGEEYFGVHIPDNAPQGTFYLGVGKIIETGTTPSGETYIWVEPYGRRNQSIFDGACDCHEGKKTAYYRFFDPESGEDMPAKYLPPYRLNQDELDRSGPGRAHRLPEPKSLPIRGSEATGVYIAPNTQMFSDNNNGSTMHYMNIPSYSLDDESLSAMMKDLLAEPRSKKDGDPPSWRYSTPAARHDTFAKLGSEAMGTYIVPDGKLYVGVGKARANGLNPCGAIYALVEVSVFPASPYPRISHQPWLACGG
ncbi:hypothetical protein BJX62DRAFT_240977 [Aspergillus germanicus]